MRTITYNKADFDGACEFLAVRFGIEPHEVAHSIRCSLWSFHDENCLGVQTGGYQLTRTFGDNSDTVFVDILVHAGATSFDIATLDPCDIVRGGPVHVDDEGRPWPPMRMA